MTLKFAHHDIKLFIYICNITYFTLRLYKSNKDQSGGFSVENKTV